MLRKDIEMCVFMLKMVRDRVYALTKEAYLYDKFNELIDRIDMYGLA